MLPRLIAWAVLSLLSIVFGSLAGVLLPEISRAQSREPAVVGAERCKLCHRAIYESWSESVHAKPWTPPESAVEDSTCARCHRTSERRASVECEACHGPGEFYSPAEIMLDRDKAQAAGLRSVGTEACRQCHRSSTAGLAGHRSLRSLPPEDEWSMWVHRMVSP